MGTSVCQPASRPHLEIERPLACRIFQFGTSLMHQGHPPGRALFFAGHRPGNCPCALASLPGPRRAPFSRASIRILIPWLPSSFALLLRTVPAPRWPGTSWSGRPRRARRSVPGLRRPGSTSAPPCRSHLVIPPHVCLTFALPGTGPSACLTSLVSIFNADHKESHCPPPGLVGSNLDGPCGVIFFSPAPARDGPRLVDGAPVNFWAQMMILPGASRGPDPTHWRARCR